MSPMASPYACLYWDSSVVNRTVSYSHDSMASGTPEVLESSWLCGTWGRPCQSFWECCLIVDTSLINLILGEIFYSC